MTLNSIYEKAFSDPFNDDFDGTTYSISKLVTTGEFHASTLKAGKIVTTPSDYGRLGHELSFALEYLINQTHEGSHSILFGSERMAYLSVALARPHHADPVHFYFEGDAPFSNEETQRLHTLNCQLTTQVSRDFRPKTSPEATVYIAKSPLTKAQMMRDGYDAVAYLAGDGQNSVLHILNPSAISPNSDSGVRFIRKRFSCASSPKETYTMARVFLGLEPVTPRPSFIQKRQYLESKLCDLFLADATAGPREAVFAHSGLAMEAALFLAVRGTHEQFRFIKPSDPYGGTHALLTLVLGKDVFGKPGVTTQDVSVLNHKKPYIVEDIIQQLSQETTFTPSAIFIESPSNPGQVIADIRDLVSKLKALCQHKQWPAIPVIVDTTMAASFMDCSYDDWPVIYTQSTSKSLSRGHAIGGVAYASHQGAEYIKAAKKWVAFFDLNPTERLMDAIAEGLPTFVEHTMQAHQHAIAFAKWYATLDSRVDYIQDNTNEIHSPLVAFFLPESHQGQEITFLTHLEKNHPTLFKYCVSYGQANGKAYVTQPSTSTHGSLKEGIISHHQLRIAFPSNADLNGLKSAITDTLNQLPPN